MQDLVLLDPLRAEDVFLADLVGIIEAKERSDEVLQCGVVNEAILELPYTT